ncbi:CPBP family intramembrane glutamic endopeptidase [Natrinema gari]|uniref:CPBP family intramembrane glutamic endopeptidase n=1 Tax=Natrinema gari TaxID=419186 RepID=UPI0019D3618B|nr:CPBP family intramembrane glutamic endopeptidase [Natrinema gari]
MVGLAVILMGAVLLSSRLFDCRPIPEFGLSLDREWWQSFAVGGLVATLVNAGAVVVALSAGWVTVAGFKGGAGELAFLPAMLLVLGYTGAAATWEEFIFRGVLLKNVAEGVSSYASERVAIGLALVFNCIVFAFLHGGKITQLSHYGYYLLAGLVLGGVYVLTGELALSISFHIFYNYTQSAVFGLGVSQQTPELFVLNIVGSAQYVGEEGLVHVGTAAVGGFLMLGYIYWRDGDLCLADRITRWTSTA